ncbi:MAG: pyruvate formate-lyase [Erysipelotrichaceae bacterium]|nr:pyruvate formate-lyase [Erysipelotrichaceae bacterium]
MTLKDTILNKKHIHHRVRIEEMAEDFKRRHLSDRERVVERFERMCEKEKPVILDDQQIVMMRTVENLPDCFTAEEWNEIRRHHYVHETGYVSNLLPDYESLIHDGLMPLYQKSDVYVQRELDALFSLSDRYQKEAEKIGRMDIAESFSWIPRKGARTLKEAFQFFRILHYAYLLEGGYQIVAGRIDQIFYPYLKKDMEEGRLSESEALELVKDFFLSFNIDSDFYDGVQQGDNGQSVVLGGVDKSGKESFNLLSKLCLQASKENRLIDPKINLRVSKETPLEIYELGSYLTKEGLGFPQYLNDDVIIEGLIKKGYALEDARDYAVAACWEIIIPKKGFEVVNIGACSFPKVLEDVLHSKRKAETFDELMIQVKNQIEIECDQLISQFQQVYFVPAPLMEASLDIQYRNFGIHGTGCSTAVDSLWALKQLVYDEKQFSIDEIIEITDHDFEGYPDLLHRLRYELPKMGQNHSGCDDIACTLLKWFCESLKGKKNEWGGIYRAGTGTAMFYLDHANEIGASCDGRKKGEPFSANYSPSLYAKIHGPLSIIESFTKPDVCDAMNGGPLTLEFSSSMFADPQSIRKTALFVKAFVQKGGHQLQCNSVNLNDLKEAQHHPERFRHLIVRIWGWSAYFVELDKDFQNHVIARQEYAL